MILSRLFKEFFSSEKTGGLLLVSCTVISLVLANSPVQSGYSSFWQYELGGHSIVHWINDGLMTVFFLLIGLELEREIYEGELSDWKNAALPIFAALGGMILPAAGFLALNYGTDAQPGAGIPTATDIAFAIGVLSLLGKKVPSSLKVFLAAFAVIDDLGAILIIALFYSATIYWLQLGIALGIFVVLLILNRLRVNLLAPYILGGFLIWVFLLQSGVHATLAGVLLAFAIPFRGHEEESPSYRLQRWLHKPVAFIILPLFAMANTSISLISLGEMGLGSSLGLGILIGLFLGKPLGIILFSWLGVKSGISSLANDLKWKYIVGAGFLGGIGFTMSIFIALLAFSNENMIIQSKIAIMLSSCLSGLVGFIMLKMMLKSEPESPEE